MNHLAHHKKDFLSSVNPSLLLFILWGLVTLFNINKPFHMDDTFHLEAAAHLRQHPLSPMSGLINWTDNPEPMWEYNQPPLYFYLLALMTTLFGENEIELHLFQSIFSLLTLFFFSRIIDLTKLRNKNWMLILFAFCPALIINQNIMTDVPILSLTLGICYFILKAKRKNSFKNYLFAALLLSAGLLIKYSILPLFIVLAISMVLNKQYKMLLVLLIPILILSLWAFCNYLEFGHAHILNRSSSVNSLKNESISMLACLGAISPFSILLLADLLKTNIKRSNFIIYTIITLCVCTPVYYYVSNQEVESVMSYTYVFMSSGAVIILYLFIKTSSEITISLKSFLMSDSAIFSLFLVGLGTFFLLFAPFIATRHILLIIPFVLFLGVSKIQRLSNTLNTLITIFCFIYGTLLGISDWKYANYFKEMTETIKIPPSAKVWSAGHWGWQHYIKKRNTYQFSTDSSEVQIGDYFICPGNISMQRKPGNLSLIEIDKFWKDADVGTFLSGSNFAGMYNTYPVRPPWVFSKAPIDTIYLYRVIKK